MPQLFAARQLASATPAAAKVAVAQPAAKAVEPQGDAADIEDDAVTPNETVVEATAPARAEAEAPAPIDHDTAKQPAKDNSEAVDSEPAASAPHRRGSLSIQIGAYESEEEAKQHLSDAQSKLRAMLAAADPFTERVRKGSKELYRARFAGFDRATAEAACRQLRRSEFACVTVRN